jgi:hypothetical protein
MDNDHKKIFGNQRSIFILSALFFFMVVIIFSQNKLFPFIKTVNNQDAIITNLPQENIKSSISPAITSYPKDENNDGIYTDFKNRFSFQYPKEIFDRQSPLSESKYSGINHLSWYKDPYYTSITLEVDTYQINKTGEGYFREYETLVNKNVGYEMGETEINYAKKLGIINNIPNSVIYYSETDHSTDYKSILYAYIAAWKNENYLITVSLSDGDKKVLENNYELFNDVIQSLELLKE